MNFQVWNYPQGSEQWFAARRGRPTASRFKDIITPTGLLSKSAAAYAYELIAECFETGAPPDFIGNKWTDRGTELEPEARAAFTEQTGLELEQVGFVTRHDQQLIGCSPDGLIKNAAGQYVAGFEAKCPTPKKHVETVAGGTLPDDYKVQVHGSLWLTGLPEWHFWSYCPGMQPFHCIVSPDAYTAKVGAALEQFVIDYAALRSRLLPLLKVTPKTETLEF